MSRPIATVDWSRPPFVPLSDRGLCVLCRGQFRFTVPERKGAERWTFYTQLASPRTGGKALKIPAVRGYICPGCRARAIDRALDRRNRRARR
jgi:hypothetical protein